jgi:hypothetical protein
MKVVGNHTHRRFERARLQPCRQVRFLSRSKSTLVDDRGAVVVRNTTAPAGGAA